MLGVPFGHCLSCTSWSWTSLILPHLSCGQVAAALVNMGDVPADITLLLSDIVCTSCARNANHIMHHRIDI